MQLVRESVASTHLFCWACISRCFEELNWIRNVITSAIPAIYATDEGEKVDSSYRKETERNAYEAIDCEVEGRIEVACRLGYVAGGLRQAETLFVGKRRM